MLCCATAGSRAPYAGRLRYEIPFANETLHSEPCSSEHQRGAMVMVQLLQSHSQQSSHPSPELQDHSDTAPAVNG